MKIILLYYSLFDLLSKSHLNYPNSSWLKKIKQPFKQSQENFMEFFRKGIIALFKNMVLVPRFSYFLLPTTHSPVYLLILARVRTEEPLEVFPILGLVWKGRNKLSQLWQQKCLKGLSWLILWIWYLIVKNEKEKAIIVFYIVYYHGKL